VALLESRVPDQVIAASTATYAPGASTPSAVVTTYSPPPGLSGGGTADPCDSLGQHPVLADLARLPARLEARATGHGVALPHPFAPRG
jgi:hypothetical protein